MFYPLVRLVLHCKRIRLTVVKMTSWNCKESPHTGGISDLFDFFFHLFQRQLKKKKDTYCHTAWTSLFRAGIWRQDHHCVTVAVKLTHWYLVPRAGRRYEKFFLKKERNSVLVRQVKHLKCIDNNQKMFNLFCSLRAEPLYILRNGTLNHHINYLKKKLGEGEEGGVVLLGLLLLPA